MKKTFVTVSLIVALATVANATGIQQDNSAVSTTRNSLSEQPATPEEHDIYQEHVLNSEEVDKHIIHFYDIDRIVIKNNKHAVIRIYDAKTNTEIARYDLDEDFSIESAVEFGRLYRHNGEWKFEAIGNGNKGGLQALVNKYAIQFA